MLVLNAHDVESCIDMGGAIAASREALAMLAQAQAEVPVRHHIGVGADADDPSVSLYMPGYIPGRRLLGVKIATLVAGNPARGLPTTPCAIVLVDPDTGLVEALIESTWLTNLKTGAGTAVATALLARDDAETCAVLLWNRTRARAEALAARLRVRWFPLSRITSSHAEETLAQVRPPALPAATSSVSSVPRAANTT